MVENQVYYGYFEDFEDVARQFDAKLDQGKIRIIFAWYGDDYGYSGQAIVVFVENKKLYEVHGSHCSCYGLEDQWQPEETTIKDLKARVLASEDESGYLNPEDKRLREFFLGADISPDDC